jgi:LysM repeat protein
MHHQSKHAAPKRVSVRHRLAGVGIAGAATIVAGITTAGSARAATVWDRVAQCESGGNWHINTGNGYYGGLQFSSSTWRGFGGTAYASRADLASKSQQITIAQKVLAVQGPGAWPVCSVKAGLTRSNGGASSGSTSTSTRKSTTKKSTTKKSTASTTKKKVAKKKTYATPRPTSTSRANGPTITVRKGDTLSELAQQHNVRGGWQAVYSANRSTISDPNLIFIGQEIRLP